MNGHSKLSKLRRRAPDARTASGTFLTRYRSTPVSVVATSGSPRPSTVLASARAASRPAGTSPLANCSAEGRGKRQDNQPDGREAPFVCHLKPPPGAKAPELRTTATSGSAVPTGRIRRRTARSNASAFQLSRVLRPDDRRRRLGRIHRSGTDRSRGIGASRSWRRRRGRLLTRHRSRLRRTRPERDRSRYCNWGRRWK